MTTTLIMELKGLIYELPLLILKMNNGRSFRKPIKGFPIPCKRSSREKKSSHILSIFHSLNSLNSLL